MKRFCTYCIRNRTAGVLLALLLLGFGVYGWFILPRAGNSGLRVRTVRIVTDYPGATPEEVLHEATAKVENALQRLGHRKTLFSRSEFGRSVVFAELTGDSAQFTQICDELRGKLASVELPPGCAAPRVYEDYGDVREAFYAVTCSGATPTELHEIAKFLQKRLMTCPDVGAIELYGVRKRALYVRFSPDRMSTLKIPVSDLRALLKDKNRVLPEGFLESGGEFLPLRYAPENDTPQSLGQTVITRTDGKLITLDDIAEIDYTYADPPEYLMFLGNREAVGLAVSAVPGGDPVRMGEGIAAKLAELERGIPAGFHVTPISVPEEAVPKIDETALSLAASFVLFVLVLILTCGFRFAAAAGCTVLLGIAGTFAYMSLSGIPLESLTLGAILFAFGMLFLDAMVVTNAVERGIRAGKHPLSAAAEASRAARPLFAGTVLSLIAYALIPLSGGAAGEFLSPLSAVLPFTLCLGWLLAFFLTPALSELFMVGVEDAPPEEHGTISMFHVPGRLVRFIVFLFVCAGGLLFLRIPTNFYPETPDGMFMTEIRLPYGTAIAETNRVSAKAEEWIRTLSGVKMTSRYVGGGAPRISANYTPEELDGSYALILVRATDARRIPELLERIRADARESFPGAEIAPRRFPFLPGSNADFQVRFSGPEFRTLERLRDECESVMRANPRTCAVGSDWRNPLPVVVPVLSEIRLRRAGIDEEAVSQAILENFQGLPVGTFRERDELATIFAQSTPGRRTPDNLDSVQVWSPAANKMLPLRQLTDRIHVVWTNGILAMRNRIPSVTVRCDALSGSAEALSSNLRERIGAITIPPGYRMEWDGVIQKSRDAWGRLVRPLWMCLIAMYAVAVLYFKSFRRAFSVWMCLPLMLPGVAAALYLTGTPFGLMALCGVLTLCGILPAFVMLRKMGTKHRVPAAVVAVSVSMIPFWIHALYAPYALAVSAGVVSAGLLMSAFFRREDAVKL